MANNGILPFGNAANSNVASDAAWLADSTVPLGFSAGRAPSAKANKAWRQAINPAAGLGQFSADWSGQDFSDAQSPATMSTNLRIAAAAAVAGAYFGVDQSSQANIVTVATAAAPPVLNNTVFLDIWVRIANTNTGPTSLTLATGSASSAKSIVRRDGSPVQAGDLVQGRIYQFFWDPSNNVWIVTRGTAEGAVTNVTGQFTANKGAAQALSNSVFTDVTLTLQGSLPSFATSFDGTNLTIAQAGLYLVSGQLNFHQTVTAATYMNAVVGLLKNGTQIMNGPGQFQANAGSTYSLSAVLPSLAVALAASDVLKLQGYLGAASNWSSGQVDSGFGTYLSVLKVA